MAVLTLRGAVLAAALTCLIVAPARADDAAVVAAIEAAYLTKFPPFVRWPADAAGPLVLCVLDNDEIAGLTESAVSKLPAGARAMTIRRVASAGQAGGCQILFVGNTGATPATLAAVSAAPMLTVTGAAAEGRKGVINFVIRDDRVRFEIDDADAARHGLEISSKLLSLAVAVKPRSEQKN